MGVKERNNLTLLYSFSSRSPLCFELWNQLSTALWVKDLLDTPCLATSRATHLHLHPNLCNSAVCLFEGSGTFILLAHLSRIWGGASHTRQKVQTGLVTAWGLRLGTFLFLRILKDGHDHRFNNVRDSPGTFFVYWSVQAAWIFMTLLPTLMLNTERHNVPLGPRDYIGWTVWGIGFATEAIADQQKWLFKRDPDNAGKFIQSGLWAYSRHPNYFGEILQWSGLWVSATSVMQGPQYLSVVSPLFVWFLLRYVSGIPILERQALKKWGSEPAFQDYIKNTPLLWPWPKF